MSQPALDGRWVLECRYDVREPAVWYLTHAYSRTVTTTAHAPISVEVPAGFAWDSASVPKAFQSIVAKWGRHSTASLLHDRLYVEKRTSRRVADDVFLKALEEDGVGWLKRHAMYRAVRLFGGGVWAD